MANKNTKKKKQKGGGDDMPNIIQAILEMKVILFLPKLSNVPHNAIGTTGKFISIAKTKPPFLNNPISPSLDRVPSG